ncbi:uncharacterized protein LOC132591490 isoform X1 [Zootoca vivipara]|uniref:uncharacterized protein LOC132591490 isoform X1 n=1 Tax=Zootoca vivipara TaxID=8524 RepID=UPI00293BE1E7|nr:uncharacterized protein LOC132591490 isoform X1 [Zootoca vivipara]XP_060126119.1 uncharacterized protein LOC132591490 isoform X1 [Zootoca vivipara]
MSQSRASSGKARSQVSGTSKSSTVSNALAIARAKAEAAKTRAAFAEQEIKMKQEKARLEASLEKLIVEKETAAAIAEADALEASLIPVSERNSVLSPDLGLQDPLQRTSEYVYQHSKSSDYVPLQQPREEDIKTATQDFYTVLLQNRDKPITLSNPANSTFKPERYNRDHMKSEPSERYDYPIPLHHSDPHHTDPTTIDFAKFLAKRELVTKGLEKFNDQPESYRAWRASFQNAIEGLDLSCWEEMDLLVKWLGKESAEHAKRIRTININYPGIGLKMIWNRLEECYGSIEAIENALFKRLDSFPKIPAKAYQKLRELSDLLMELQVAKSEGDLPGLTFLDTARGVNPIVQKLPYNLQEQWIAHGSKFKRKHNVPYPPFSVFVDFVNQQAKMRNDPSFDFSLSSVISHGLNKPPISVHKINVDSPDSPFRSASSSLTEARIKDPDKQCPLHRKPHPLQNCRTFREKPLEERKAFLKQNNLCYKCCSAFHLSKDCKVSLRCRECDSSDHNTALHPGSAPWSLQHTDSFTEHGGEQKHTPTTTPEITSKCTEVCKGTITGKSCSKICLVRVYPVGNRNKAIKLYAILDDQSNKSLASPTFFDMFDIKGPSFPYSLKTCSGNVETAGRRASGYKVESLDGQTSLTLPTLIECNQIPDQRSEIPTPDAARHHPHLKRIVNLIPQLDPQARIILLLGRDILEVHKARAQINGPHNASYAQKLDLGWVIIGDVCLGSMHKPNSVNSMLTNTLENGRPSLFQPCHNHFIIKELPQKNHSICPVVNLPNEDVGCDSDTDHLGCTVFQRTRDDNKVAMSIEDKMFLRTMEREFVKDDTNSWVAPLPFKPQRRRLPNNRDQVLKRLSSLRHNLQRKPEIRNHFFSFMDKIFKNRHAEIAPILKNSEECWYLPIFGVYHPKKPGQIRVVFDSSAKFEGISLNDVLLTGPDLNNKLLGVLLRFREDSIAFTADIQQMFHCFFVREEDRNFLRFFWFRDNDFSKDIIEYRMKVHIFGNSPSPAVAIYGLRHSAREGEAVHGTDVRQLVEKNFYVDDCLKSLPSTESAISLLKRAQQMFACFNLRLQDCFK